jgi:hypothetical protein
MTIDAALATVTANNKAKTYGDVNPALDATVVGEIAGGDAGELHAVDHGDAVQRRGGQPLRNRGQPRRERELQRHAVDGAMTIDAALATVTANNKAKTYGDVNPALDAVVVGEIAGGGRGQLHAVDGRRPSSAAWRAAPTQSRSASARTRTTTSRRSTAR